MGCPLRKSAESGCVISEQKLFEKRKGEYKVYSHQEKGSKSLIAILLSWHAGETFGPLKL